MKRTMNRLDIRLRNSWIRDIWGIYGGLWNGLWMCNKRCGKVCNWLQMLKTLFCLLWHFFFYSVDAFTYHNIRLYRGWSWNLHIYKEENLFVCSFFIHFDIVLAITQKIFENQSFHSSRIFQQWDASICGQTALKFNWLAHIIHKSTFVQNIWTERNEGKIS